MMLSALIATRLSSSSILTASSRGGQARHTGWCQSLRVARSYLFCSDASERYHALAEFDRLLKVCKCALGQLQVGVHIIRTSQKRPRSPC